MAKWKIHKQVLELGPAHSDSRPDFGCIATSRRSLEAWLPSRLHFLFWQRCSVATLQVPPTFTQLRAHRLQILSCLALLSIQAFTMCH